MSAFTVELGFGIVVVRDVPAQVCDLCGTDWLEDSVAEKLELIIEQARRNQPVVEVAVWQQEIQAGSINRERWASFVSPSC